MLYESINLLSLRYYPDICSLRIKPMAKVNSGLFECNASAAGKLKIERIAGKTGGISDKEKGGAASGVIQTHANTGRLCP